MTSNRTISRLVAVVMVVGTFAAAAAEPPQTNTVPAAQALERLTKGNARYVENKPQRPDSRPVGTSQTPFAAVVSCADARVPVEILFDQGVNDTFVVRVAGNTVGDPASSPGSADTLQMQSLAFAVTSLKVNLIFVLGHDECGAVKGAVGLCGGSGIGPMFQNICSTVKETDQPQPSADQRLKSAVTTNVQNQVNLLKRTPPFAEMVKAGTLKIVGGVYEMKSGRVTVTAP